MRTSALGAAIVLLVLGACAHQADMRDARWVEEGTASWYGQKFHGRPTASGQIYNMYGLSAAHKTLPLGCRVRVTNLANGRAVVVPVNDRGPFVGQRIIDMSYGAARKLGMVEEGLATVRLEVIQTPKHVADCRYALQFGAFTLEENADQVAAALRTRGYKPRIEAIQAHGQSFFRVRLGRFASLPKAQHACRGFGAAGLACIVIAL